MKKEFKDMTVAEWNAWYTKEQIKEGFKKVGKVTAIVSLSVLLLWAVTALIGGLISMFINFIIL